MGWCDRPLALNVKKQDGSSSSYLVFDNVIIHGCSLHASSHCDGRLLTLVGRSRSYTVTSPADAAGEAK